MERELPVASFIRTENGSVLFKFHTLFQVDYRSGERTWGETLDFGSFCRFINTFELKALDEMLNFSNIEVFEKYIVKLSDYYYSRYWYDDLDDPLPWPSLEERELKVVKYNFEMFKCYAMDGDITHEIDFQWFCKSLPKDENIVLQEMLFEVGLTEFYKKRIFK